MKPRDPAPHPPTPSSRSNAACQPVAAHQAMALARDYASRQRHLDRLAVLLVTAVSAAVFWLLPALAPSPSAPAAPMGAAHPHATLPAH